ncbi:MAG: alpha/beta hydrolase family protein [Gemmatimonadota bacterium]
MTATRGRGGEARHTPFVFPLPTGDRIRGDAWLPETAVPEAAIVVCHGFKGFKDWGFFPYLTEELTRRTGCVSVCFNFTGSGVGESLDTFDELERFGRNTFTRELQDLEAVMDRLAAGRLGELELPAARRFGLLGHSRGGATAILKASLRSQVHSLVTWAAVASVERYQEAYAERWEAGETVYIENRRTGQMMPLERNVLDDIRANRDRLDPRVAAAALRIPYLVLHGTADESVPPEDAEALKAAAGDGAELVWIEGGTHTMNAAHPFRGSNASLERAIELSARRLRSDLAAG